MFVFLSFCLYFIDLNHSFFTCVYASLYKGLPVRPLVDWSVHWFFWLSIQNANFWNPKIWCNQDQLISNSAPSYKICMNRCWNPSQVWCSFQFRDTPFLLSVMVFSKCTKRNGWILFANILNNLMSQSLRILCKFWWNSLPQPCSGNTIWVWSRI